MTGWVTPPDESRGQKAARSLFTSIGIVIAAFAILGVGVVVFFGLIYGW